MKIYKLDVVKYGELYKKYKVIGVPTLFYFKDGKVVDKKMGIHSVEKLEDLEIKNF